MKVLSFLYEHWISAIIALALLVLIIHSIVVFCKHSKSERINIIKKQLSNIMLKFVSDAEEDYESYHNAGALKRAQVIAQIYEKYPILTKLADQESLVTWIDQRIDEALELVRDILEEVEDEDA